MSEDKNKKIDEELDDILEDLKDDNKKINDASSESDNGVDSLMAVLRETQDNINRALELISQKSGGMIDSVLNLKLEKAGDGSASGSQRIVEGVFNGEAMVGADGKRYNVPANYASKSKLVEGDILKLTITKDGSFIYKQIGPIERKQLITALALDETSGDWYALKDKKRWKLLTASVTYFHGEPGDEVVIIIPKNSTSNWAAVENIIKV